MKKLRSKTKEIKEIEVKDTNVTRDDGVKVLDWEVSIKTDDVPSVPLIGRISEDFGREDLNTIARKINEIITKVKL